jgi:hypothetical protein
VPLWRARLDDGVRNRYGQRAMTMMTDVKNGPCAPGEIAGHTSRCSSAGRTICPVQSLFAEIFDR